MGFRPVGFALFFGELSFAGFSGAFGRSSNARRSSPSTRGAALMERRVFRHFTRRRPGLSGGTGSGGAPLA